MITPALLTAVTDLLRQLLDERRAHAADTRLPSLTREHHGRIAVALAVLLDQLPAADAVEPSDGQPAADPASPSWSGGEPA